MTDRIRVLEIIQTLGIGGAETVLYNVACHLDPTRFDVRALIVGGGELIDRLRAHGHEVDTFDFARSYNLDLIRFIRRLIKKHRIDIVHTHLSRMNMYGCVASLLTPAHNVMTVHGLTEFSSGIARVYYSLFGNLSGRVVTVSQRLADELLSRTWLRTGNVSAIHNGIDIARFGKSVQRDALLARFNVSPDAVVILAVGNIRAIKGYDFLIEAFARIAREESRAVLIICGNDIRGEKGLLDALVAKYDLGRRIIFTMFVPEIEQVYAAADIYVLTSVTEGFSLTTVEAMASSLPVVATDCIGPREIITDGVDGIIVPERAPERFATEVLDLIRDPDRRKALGQAARRTAESRFSITESARQFEQLFASMVDRS